MTITKYEPGFIPDLALLAWWMHLCDTGDMAACFGGDMSPLGAFMRTFGDGSTELWTVGDDAGWWGAVWVGRVMSAGTYSLWLRADKRASKEALDFVHSTLQMQEARFPVLLFVTRNQAVMAQAERLGFVALGAIPYLFDGQNALIGYMAPAFAEGAEVAH